VRLRGVPHGPVALDVEGASALLHAPLVAIVGARACTGDGRRRAALLARHVVSEGGVVLSGGAWGIDAEAHGAAAGRTIAVLGQGLRAPMPGWQTRLRGELLARGGLVVSEMAPHAQARPWTFPVRNRILAALADVVVVVEAGERSGAGITARLAAEMGREVMAVPGSPGCDALLADGVTAVHGTGCVLASLRRVWSVHRRAAVRPGSC
jgi:DNA processing protein